jgi:hypothetical protein
MNAAGQTLCLNMIVNNEAPVIRRCLDSLRPIIDHWVIVDTGSARQTIIREYLKDLQGELHERPWAISRPPSPVQLGLPRQGCRWWDGLTSPLRNPVSVERVWLDVDGERGGLIAGRDQDDDDQPAIERFQPVAQVISLVGDQLGGLLGRRRRSDVVAYMHLFTDRLFLPPT